MPATLTIDDRELQAALASLQQAVGNLRPLYFDIAEDLLQSTQARFSTKTAPDGEAWAANTQTTINLEWKRKDGSIRPAKGRNDPLVGETGALKDEIFYAVAGDSLELGSPMVYAAMMQFGGTKAEFPYLLGDIPARPFLGFSNDDISGILAKIEEHLKKAL